MHSGRQRASVLLSTCVSVSYARKPHVLRDITLSMGRGEVLGLVGQSGSGKSTLALAILGLLDAKSVKVEGSIEFQGCDLLKLRERELRKIRGRSLGLVLQSPLSSLNPALKIRTQLREAWRAHAAGTGTECEVAIRLSLASVSLPADEEFLRRRPSQLSVGQAQRVLIAMTIMHHPALLIADEATSALDVMYYTPPTSTDVNTAKGLGCSNGKAIGLVKGYGWAMSQGNVSSLISKDSNIKYVSLDRKLQSAMNYAVPAVGADIALSMSYDGTGVGVAVIDSGVNSVFDLTQSGASKTSRIVYSQNFDPSANTTNDLYGHGTHVAGELTAEFGTPYYTRIDASATPEQKVKLQKLSPDAVKESDLAGEPITAKLTRAPGNQAPVGGLKVVAESGWFAARPSGTENIYKIYAESFKSESHLHAILSEAEEMVNSALDSEVRQ